MNQSEQEHRLMSVLDRQTTCDVLSALVSAIKPDTLTISLADTAIGLDANAFLRLVNHKKSADVIDYLSSRHIAPLILPGQAIQEFWNNQLQAVDTVVVAFKKHFESFKSALAKVDRSFGDYIPRMEDLLDQFSAEHGHVYDEGTVRRTSALLDALARCAVVSYASRVRYQGIADLRKKTKTPPGFRDEGDGDFFIWADLLTGLQQSQVDGKNFSRVAFVSLERKPDWIRAGVAHPILAAEVKALFGASFEIWTLDKLAIEISTAT